MRKSILLLFLLHLTTRLGFIFLNGFYNNYQLQPDSYWLVDFGLSKAANFNFNFELPRFVASPLYSTFVGLMKICFGDGWNTALIIIQLFISTISGIYIFKIGHLIFNYRVGILSSIIYSIFPLTLWYTNTFSQECLFQCFMIFCLYFLVRSIYDRKLRFVFFSSLFFSLSYLTKSHILLFSIFIPIIYIYYLGLNRTSLLFSSLYAGLALILSLPYGIYSLNQYGQYIISSNGAKYQFYLGNTEAGYKSIVDVPTMNTIEFQQVQNITVTAGLFNGSQEHYDSLLNQPQCIKQNAFYNEAITWIKENPYKFVQVKIYDLFFFLTPGVSWRHYSLNKWLFAFLVSFPIYFFAYITMIQLYISRRKEGFIILCLFITMLIFSLVWYVQNRFRTITIEPYYIIYAAYSIENVIGKRIKSLEIKFRSLLSST